MTDPIHAARAILRRNDRGGYTVPTAGLYPFQWNWDSAFVAMGWATFDVDRAWAEIESLLLGQWTDGRIPHIVFHAPADTYYPGPSVWGASHEPPTSGIVQPPVLATAVRHVYQADPARGRRRLAAAFPKLAMNHRWWRSARDPAGDGLVAILHPWESGMDNSPAWDEAMARVPATTSAPVRRADTTFVDPGMRPQAEDYARFIHLVEAFRTEGWDAARMYRASPFRVADVSTNAVLLRAERDLLALARTLGRDDETAAIEERIGRIERSIGELWNPSLGVFVSLDLVSGRKSAIATSAGFLPLWAGVGDAAALARTLRRWRRFAPRGIPSTDPQSPLFEPRRYWRGPVWAIVDRMIAEGFAAAGDRATANEIDRDSRELIDGAGFFEYFDPTTGEGAGGADFSWTAAMRLLGPSGGETTE